MFIREGVHEELLAAIEYVRAGPGPVHGASIAGSERNAAADAVEWFNGGERFPLLIDVALDAVHVMEVVGLGGEGSEPLDVREMLRNNDVGFVIEEFLSPFLREAENEAYPPDAIPCGCSVS